jgi:NAD(P)-dependent dehydrogenase (short-subunit alcohol dehydrogenase family)
MTTSPVMLITGASRGIGAAVARLAAEAGYDVAFSYNSDERSAAHVAAAVEATGRRALAMRCDVAVESEVIALFDQTVDTFGRLDAVVVNAGVVFPRSRVEDLTVERIERIMAVNVTGAFLTARESARHMAVDNGGSGGSIVIVSSAASRLGSANEFVDYAASKGATDSLTIGLANELADRGVRVNAVRPGLIYTDIHADAGAPDRVDELKHNVPMKRGGSAEETAAPIVWLCSEGASYITGTILDITGGR